MGRRGGTLPADDAAWASVPLAKKLSYSARDLTTVEGATSNWAVNGCPMRFGLRSLKRYPVTRVDPSGKVQARSVTVGLETPDDVEIVSGLQEGDLVAVGDRSGLRAGETVRPKIVELIKNPSAEESEE